MPAVATIPSPHRARYPSGELRYARNPWSLTYFDGKVFLGAGNSNNEPPAANAGPVPVFAIDVASQRVASEFEIQDEQIDVFRILERGGRQELWVPGHDSKEPMISDWMFGNVYRRRPGGGGWEKQRTLKNGIHIYDLAFHDGKMFAALANLFGAFVARSTDEGLTWHEMPCAVLPYNRTRALFAIGGELYASTGGRTGAGKLYKWDGARTMVSAGGALFAGLGGNVFAARPTPLGPFSSAAEVALIAAKPIIDHDWEPLALMIASAGPTARRLTLPGNATPRDLLFSDGQLYILASSPAGTRFKVHVFVGKSGPKEVFQIEAPTFARSFALAPGGDFYLGLGSDPNAIRDETGDILRVKVKL